MAFYKQIFSIKITNSYYKDLNSQDFDIVPTPKTQELFKNHKVIYKMVGGTLLAVAKSIGDDVSGHEIENALGSAKLSFNLILKNPNFSNFTDVPLNANQGNIHRFTNLTDNGFPLLESTTNIKNGSTLVDLTSSFYTIDSVNVNDEITVVEKGLNQNAFYIKLKAEDIVDGKYLLDFNKINLESGYYEIQKNSTALPSPIIGYYNKEAHNGKVFGVIELYNDSSVPGTYQFVNWTTKKIEQKDYELAFTNRSTKWKYVVNVKNNPDLITEFDTAISNSNTSLSTLSITNTASVNFTQQQNLIAPSNNKDRRQVIFELGASEDLPIKEDVIKEIKLIHSGTPIISNLPNASVAFLSKDTNNNLQSEISVIV